MSPLFTGGTQGDRNMLPLYARIEQLCLAQDMNITEMCRRTGVARAVLSDYKAGRRQTIGVKNLEKIADYFSVSMDWLLGKTPIRSVAESPQSEHLPPNVPMDNFTYAFLDESQHLSAQDKETLLNMVRFLRQQKSNLPPKHEE